MSDKVTIAALQQMKRDGKKIAGVVAWDTPIAKIADLAGVDLASVGDSVGVNLWGHDDPLQVTMDEMLIVCKAVRRGTTRALVSCDLPYGPVQHSPKAAIAAAGRLMKDGGADMIKVDAAADFPDAVRAESVLALVASAPACPAGRSRISLASRGQRGRYAYRCGESIPRNSHRGLDACRGRSLGGCSGKGGQRRR